MRGQALELVTCALALSALGPDSVVRAQDVERARVHVLQARCEPLSGELDEAVRLLGVELVGDDVRPVVTIGPALPPDDEAAEGAEIARVSLQPVPCDADATRFDVTIDDAITRKRVQRVIDLSALPRDARPRALALAMAELLRASWNELTQQPGAHPAVAVDEQVLRWITSRATPPEEEPRHAELPAPIADPLPPQDPVAAPEPPPPLHLQGSALFRVFPADGSSLLGLRAGAALPLGQTLPLRLRIEGSFELGRVRVILGDIAVGLAAGALGLDISSDAAAPVGVDIGPRVEVGWGWASGTPADETDVGLDGGAVVVTLSIHAGIRVSLGGAWHGLLDAQVGYTLAGLDAQVDDRSTTGLAGPAMALAIGLGAAL